MTVRRQRPARRSGALAPTRGGGGRGRSASSMLQRGRARGATEPRHPLHPHPRCCDTLCAAPCNEVTEGLRVMISHRRFSHLAALLAAFAARGPTGGRPGQGRQGAGEQRRADQGRQQRIEHCVRQGQWQPHRNEGRIYCLVKWDSPYTANPSAS